MNSTKNNSIYSSFSEAYLSTLRDIYQNGDELSGITKEEYLTGNSNQEYNISDPIMQNDNYYYNRAASKELLNYSFTITKPSLEERLTTRSEKHNRIIQNYTDKETELFDRGDIHNMGTLSKVWDLIKNPDGTVNANYGYMVYHINDAGNEKYAPDEKPTNQWTWAREMLIRNKNTLQAYCHFNRPKDQWKGNLDQPCTMYIQFIIRKDELHLHGYMRSNDIVYGTPYNIAYFIKLMYRMLDELITVYPNLKIGNYTHHATGIHYYKRNEDRVREMLGYTI
uniref:Thymidylate synthase/dCMp hydroxymethylase n=1 Tax=Fadolivirus 2 TaxID=2740747 RepID=A0A7D3QX04_9VIRU|nr:thymidylate synthase/dCMp hydroxymethylase [Fadolivirus 2]